MDTRFYPQGRAPFYSKYVSGVLKFFKRSSAAEMMAIDGTAGVVYEAGKLYNKYDRATAAEVNAGKVVLPAIPGYKYRLEDAIFIAIGGNAATATSVDLLATQGGSAVRPLVVAVAALGRSVVTRAGVANAVILADGDSFKDLDANTSVTIVKQSGGSNLATATHIDSLLSYELVRA